MVGKTQNLVGVFIAFGMKKTFKDEKAKDKVGVGDKPPLPSFHNLIKFIKFDQVLSNLIQFDPIWSSLNKFDPIYCNLIQFDQVCDKLNQVDPI